MGSVERIEPSDRYSGGYSKHFKGQKIDCNRCGFTYYRYERERGQRIRKTKHGWICDNCFENGD